MSFVRTYFLCPSANFIDPPPTGPLRLGSIIFSTSRPQYSLNKGHVVDVADVSSSFVENNWKKTSPSETSLGLGIYAQFLQLATGGQLLGPEVDVGRSKASTNTYNFDTMITSAFEPTQEYVEEAVKAPGVKAWLREHNHRILSSELFLVTGIKVVNDATIECSTSQSTIIQGSFGIDWAAMGVSCGPKGHWTTMNSDATESSHNSEFVFAFRVKRLKLGRKLKVEDYNTGALMSVGEEKDDGIPVLAEDLNGADIGAAEFVCDESEGDNVYCVAP